MSDDHEPTDEIVDDIVDDIDDDLTVDAADDSDTIAVLQPTYEDMIEAARRRYGKGGAAVAAGMFGLDVALGNKKKPESVQIQEAKSKPVDVDADGIELPIDATTTVTTPALERRNPIGVGKRKPRRK